MDLFKGIGGLVCILIGAVWIGQGTGLLPGSVMSGQMMWTIIGVGLVVIGAWLVWGLIRGRRGSAGKGT